MTQRDDDEPFGPRLVILAAERTLVGWIRLSLTLMGLGFILDRFGIYIRTQGVTAGAAWLPRAFTYWMGAALVAAGAVTSIASGLIYARLRREHARAGHPVSAGSGRLSALLSAFVALIGVVTAVFLLTITD